LTTRLPGLERWRVSRQLPIVRRRAALKNDSIT